MTALVVGLGVTGRAVVSALVRRGVRVVVVEDHPTDAHRSESDLLGVELLESPSADALAHVLAEVDELLPSPGIPDAHPVFALARAAAVPVASELDLAARWDARPTLAITGTDGKTTVTTMVTDMLMASGVRAVAAGNTDVPLVAAIDDPTTDVFVVEASSFRLGHSRAWAPTVGTWLNFAPDHLDVHASLQSYEDAKASLWSRLAADGVAVANADDPVVVRHLRGDRRSVRFTTRATVDAQYRLEGTQLVAPVGVLCDTADLFRDLPHDVANALAASATALEGGASVEGVRRALGEFRGLAHRVSFVAEADGVRWYDDSKATVPHAAAAAVRSFPSVVLIAGGRNKGLDLGALAEVSPHLRAAVAIGESAPDIVDALGGACPVEVAASMDAAVRAAARFAQRGDAVVLSPGCASFDWYRSYAERGDDFVRAVRAHLAQVGS